MSKGLTNREEFELNLLNSYNKFINVMVINKPNYMDKDFNFESYMRWLTSQYQRQ